ncbi:hypothetical protein D3C85_1482480 [compost metagenome]
MQGASQAGAQEGFGSGQLLGVKQRGGDPVLAQPCLLAFGFGHVVAIGGDPQGAAFGIGAGRVRRVHARTPLPPRVHRQAAQCQFGGATIHDDQMPHAGLRGAFQVGVHDMHRQARARQMVRAGGADNARADDQDVF